MLCACGLLTGLLSGEPFDARDAVTLLAILTGLVTGLLEDRLNARAAKARLLPGTEHAATVFDEDGYTMTTGVTETRWRYAQILAIAETKRYFILALSKNHAQAVDKEGMQGGRGAGGACVKKRTESRSHISKNKSDLAQRQGENQ